MRSTKGIVGCAILIVVFATLGFAYRAAGGQTPQYRPSWDEFFTPTPETACVLLDDPSGRSLPGDLAVDDAADRVYVVDEGLRKVLIYGTDLVLKETWPPPEADYSLRAPIGIGLGEKGEPVFLSDGGDLLFLSRQGRLLRRINLAEATRVLPHPVRIANDIAMSLDGTLWVTDSLGRQVAAFSRDGTFIEAVDATGRMGTLGTILPTSRGSLLVADPMNARILELLPEFDNTAFRWRFRFGDYWFGEKHRCGDDLWSIDAMVETGPDVVLVASAYRQQVRRFLHHHLPFPGQEYVDVKRCYEVTSEIDRELNERLRGVYDSTGIAKLRTEFLEDFKTKNSRLYEFWKSCREKKPYFAGFCHGMAWCARRGEVFFTRRFGGTLCRFVEP